jgi:hypothetical protein
MMAEQISIATILNKILPLANTHGLLCITFSLAGVEPVATDKNPMRKNIKKYIQVAGRLARYFSSNKNICQNIFCSFKVG